MGKQILVLEAGSIGGQVVEMGLTTTSLLNAEKFQVIVPNSLFSPLNARLLAEKGLAAEVKRDEDGSFSKDDIAKTLRLAIVEEEGEPLRVNARKAAVFFGDQKLHQDHYLGAFVDFLKYNVAKRSST
ncbi:hypothetical protein M0R45_034299 [Rubus argutus]|uniref:Mechanosensitive ion channel MscS domain-containing protein n=1 Tax=Rubus argutus TaxID=59490 RepID=A0AAW1VPW6_RUBAR